MIFLFLKIDLISYKKISKYCSYLSKSYIYIYLCVCVCVLFFSYISHFRALPHTYLMYCTQCMKEIYRYMKWNVKEVHILYKNMYNIMFLPHLDLFGLIPLALFPSFQWVLFIGYSGEANFLSF